MVAYVYNSSENKWYLCFNMNKSQKYNSEQGELQKDICRVVPLKAFKCAKQ